MAAGYGTGTVSWTARVVGSLITGIAGLMGGNCTVSLRKKTENVNILYILTFSGKDAHRLEEKCNCFSIFASSTDEKY